jgi:hypothetical protein
MVIKTKFLASLLTKLGHEVKAELVIDDSNGVSLTFPEISDIAEIAEGVAVDAPDGTYVIANETDTITIVVLSGVVTSYTTEAVVAAEEPATELGAEVEAVLEAVVEAYNGLNAKFVALETDHKTLKASLKHSEEKPGAAAAQQSADKYKIID